MEKKYFNPGDNLSDPYAVRENVFVKEQGFSSELEFDETDQIAHHTVLYNNGVPVATGRAFPSEELPNEYIIGRVAVVKDSRGKNLGKEVMTALEAKIKELGAKSIYLGAQDHAAPFYEKLGYKICGEAYMDEHVAHYPMRKKLA